MAAFSRSRRPLFGLPMQAEPQMAPEPISEPSPDVAQMPGYRKPSTAQTIVGVVGDTLAEINGGQATFIPQLFAQQQAAQEYAMGQRQRAEGFADWQRREQWKRDNPEPRSNDTVEDYNFIVQTLGADAGKKFLENRADPPQLMMTPQGIVSVPRSGGYGAAPAPSGPQPGTVEGGYRFKGGNPADPNAWEPVGGASPTGSRTFP